MKTLNTLVLSILITSSVAAYAGESSEIKAPSTAQTEKIAGSYRISKSYPLTKTVHGIDGALQLLQDSRLTKHDYDKQFGTAYKYVNRVDEKGLALFKDNPPLGTVLRVLANNDKFLAVRESRTYDLVPVAWLEEVALSNPYKPTYLFTLDESQGMGSYTGPVTYFYAIADGKLKAIEYLDADTKNREQMVLMRSLKTAWKLVNSKDGKSKDILHIACRPDGTSDSKGEDVFLVSYDRFRFEGKGWVRYRRVERGFWEAEGDFPFSKFPAGP